MDIENIQLGSTPQAYATAAQVAQQRKLAQLLISGEGQEKRPVHPLEMFGNIANRAVGNMRLNQANELERGSQLHDAESFAGGTQEPAPGQHVPASVRNNNPGAQWPGSVSSQFGSTGAENLKDGNKIAAFDDPVKGGAAHFALLAQKYSGMPLEAAISKWSGGNSSAPYSQFIAGRTGLDPATPITPELLKSQQGISLVKAMADWEAGGRYPMTDQQWIKANQMAFGGKEQGPGGKPMAFSGEPSENALPGESNPLFNMAQALQSPKGGSIPVPGGPVTRAPVDGDQPGNILPSAVVPHRIPMSKEGLINTLASGYLDPAVKNTALQLYLEQSQPMQMKTPGGTMSIGANGQQVIIPDLYQTPLESNGNKITQGSTFRWKPGMDAPERVISPTVMGGQNTPIGQGQAPGMLGAEPPAPGQIPTGQQPSINSPAGLQSAGNPFIPPDMRGIAQFGQDQDRQKHWMQEDQKEVMAMVKEAKDLGIKAAKNISQIQTLQRLVEDPKNYQGIGRDAWLDLNRIGAALGFKEGERGATLMQAFDKLTSGNIIADLTTQLQGTGQIRVAEIQLLQKAAASPYNTPEANRAILKLMVKSSEQLTGLTRATQDYLATHKQNASTEGLMKAKLDWLEKNPMMSPKEIEEYASLFEKDPKYAPPANVKGGASSNFRQPQPALPNPPVNSGLPDGFTVRPRQ